MEQKNEPKYRIVELKDSWRNGEAPTAELKSLETDGWEFVCYNTYLNGPDHIYPISALLRHEAELPLSDYEYEVELLHTDYVDAKDIEERKKDGWEYMQELTGKVLMHFRQNDRENLLLLFRRPKTVKEP